MKTNAKIAISVSSVVVAIIITVVLLVVLRKPNCDACSMMCGVSCRGKPKCRGTRCDDPDAVCVDGSCVLRHSCSDTGECVPDPNGPFVGNTCKCFSVVEPTACEPGTECAQMARTTGSCELVGNDGDYATRKACEARDADFECVPGTGTCERVLGSTTGWKSEDACKCFECKDMTCTPTSNPVGEIDGVTCGECGMWKCESGECVQTKTGGTWVDRSHCRCGGCVDGECVAMDSGGAYVSVSECRSDGAKVCKDPTLGWGCNQLAGNEQMCAQVPGGGASSLDACSCWTCAGTPPGPSSMCTFDASGGGKYDTYQECFDNETDKCGWKYMCQR
jgi:hypothetical protein